MATYSSILAWRIPGTEEPGGLPSMGSHRVGHDWCDLAAAGHCRACVCSWSNEEHYMGLRQGTLWDDLDFEMIMPNTMIRKDKGTPRLVAQSVNDSPSMQETAWSTGDLGLIPGSGRFLGEGHSNPLQYSCLENPMDRRAWWVHGIANSWTWLSD